ncbi:hypothetical protein AVEN_269212-1 [Araneus ventricosus]|uniref:LITAF domain-containing protein n=1 Tax=Araneus ventricosus TaxID=182803 RepID=A0A4Y2I1Z4_ARAVE|nr:hypothetical protein AVEN_269212-1 [Araneus ventricosus]
MAWACTLPVIVPVVEPLGLQPQQSSYCSNCHSDIGRRMLKTEIFSLAPFKTADFLKTHLELDSCSTLGEFSPPHPHYLYLRFKACRKWSCRLGVWSRSLKRSSQTSPPLKKSASIRPAARHVKESVLDL